MTPETPDPPPVYPDDPWKGVKRKRASVYYAHPGMVGVCEMNVYVAEEVDAARAADALRHQQEVEQWKRFGDAEFERRKEVVQEAHTLREALETIAHGGPKEGQRTGPMKMYQAQALASAALATRPQEQP